MKEIKFNLVSFGLLIALLLLLVLSLLLGFSLYNTQKALENSKISQTNTLTNEVTNNKETVNEVTEKDNASAEDVNKGEEVDSTTPEIKKVLDKIDYDTPYLAGIYKQGNFNRETIPNDLILRLAFESWTYEREFKSNEPGTIEKISKEEMKNYITELFGKNIKYNDVSFLNITVPTFDSYTEFLGEVYFQEQNDEYSAEWQAVGGGDKNFIHQQVEKVLKYDDKLDVYVKTVFVKVGWLDEKDDFKYEIYKNYDFRQDEFEKILIDDLRRKFLC